jgi:hypothetical protein
MMNTRIDKDLKNARDAHRQRTGHKNFFVGMNFINCEDCGRHAHIGGPSGLIAHDPDYIDIEHITPKEF